MSNTMTPYAAAKAVNAQLAELGIEKVLPPQMLYTYVSKGYIESVTDEAGKKRVTAEALAKWFTGYVTKATKQAVAETTDEVEADNDGTVGEWVETDEVTQRVAQREQELDDAFDTEVDDEA